MGSDLWVLVTCHSLSQYKRLLRLKTDVTLPDEVTNSILADDANRTIPGNMAMHVAPPGGQI